ncbi:MAG: ABC transporter ATP-binding protein [Burkholderiales bacterium]|nr:MAG: ABC transporter ATP-binding protein [Burkholderiales bacterium]
MLELVGLACGYGEMTVVHDLDLRVEAGQTVAMVGANGAGKTSTLMAIAGHVRQHRGEIRLDGQRIDALSPMQRVALGVGWVPEGRRLFPDLSVRENLVVGGYVRARSHEAASLERVVDLFPRVGERLNQRAGSLSGGEQQMVALGRALMAEPRLLLVDELSLGLMPKAVGQFYAALARLKASGLAILLVEQNTGHALRAADAVVVLESGAAVWRGTAEAARAATGMLDAYLGLARAQAETAG